MSKYRLQILTRTGQKQLYEIEAATQKDAIAKARQNGFFVLKTLPVSSTFPHFKSFHFNRPKDVLLFIKKLGLLLASSLPLSESLLFLAKNTSKPPFRKIILALHEHISEGLSLSDAMQRYPAYFTSTICAVVLAGEKSGHMDDALAHLTQYLENRDEMNSAVRQALAYPALLIVVSITIIILLMSIAIPSIAEQLTQSNIPLPMSTRLVIATSYFINNWWIVLFIGLLLIMFAVKGVLLFTAVRLTLHKNFLNLPVIGSIIKKTQTASVLMTLAILTQFSVPLLDAFRVSREVISNLWLKNQLTDAYSNINEGSTIYHALVNANILDTTTLALLSAGEKSGDFSAMVNYATQMLRREIKSTLSTFIKLLEPMLIFIVGFIVLFIFMSIIQPMLSLNNMVQ